MSWSLHRHDARHISGLLDPESVDLIVTSPPYFALRSYRDGGEHYDGQVGSEATPAEFVDTLIACTADWLEVLRPGGSLWVNLGDKYAGSGGHNNQGISTHGIGSSSLRGGRGDLERRAALGEAIRATRRNAPDRYTHSSDGIPAKSLMGLPWRYALRCVDELGLILRAEVIWSKPNGLPESVTDRVRRSHEQWFHFTRQGRYFAAIDEVREEHAPGSAERSRAGFKANTRLDPGNSAGNLRIVELADGYDVNPLGKVPGSVWSIPSEPLDVPADLGVDHFAAFPSELPRRIILGWSPSGWCTGCGEARRAVVEKRQALLPDGLTCRCGVRHGRTRPGSEYMAAQMAEQFACNETTITGYACACPTVDAPTRPAVVLDPFAGTGTVPAVAHLLGRHGIGVDLSRDYLRLAEWRCTKDRALRDKVLDRTGIPNPDPPKIDGQLVLFGETS